MRYAVLAFLLISLPLTAQAAPVKAAAPVHSASQLDQLFRQLSDAETEDEAKPIEQQIEALFLQSGSATIDLLMTRGAAALQAGDSKLAAKLVTTVTEIAPGFAEGWHQRAQLQGLSGDDAGAMASLERAVALNPRAFAALSQLADMLEDYGNKPAALKAWRRVKAIDPHAEGIDRRIRALSHAVEGQGI